ncbi:ribonuclease H-like domain-containing protein [Colletotrichum phormii]|uniref:Ribonuclease H-like domain-containing protein n=1 Tax=Colletotrichum phormii TaxID=359342 RepID=A0AAI9ZEJ4_9PEZI|nr:ribonuclease H-like domain-containing protein [Colletotrichum phormii]KAK1622783.1 ribonuclease H-like domain-containing protein [Colletotrichum phormii]
MAFYQQPQNPYGPPSLVIEPTQSYLYRLRSMAHRKDVLVKSGFILNPLSERDVDDKKRCRRCNLRCSNNRNKFKSIGKGSQADAKSSSAQPKTKTFTRSSSMDDEEPEGAKADEKPAKPVLKCQYHTGRVINMRWNCCRVHVSEPGCTYAPEHLVRTYPSGEVHARHQYHKTPTHALLNLGIDTVSSSQRVPRRAVAMDCEMGVAYDGESELIRVTLIDYFTSEILLDSLVYPQVRMAHYNTRYSGVSRPDMEAAKSKGKCITGGLANVRAAVWEWVSAETIVVGHAVHNDLASLRWIHPKVVDSLILATNVRAEIERLEAEEERRANKEAAADGGGVKLEEEDLISFDKPKDSEKANEGGSSTEKKPQKRKTGGLSLKALTSEMLGRDIQKGRIGHDSLEDALASRDLVHCFVAKKLAESAAEGGLIIPGFW